MSGYIVLWLQSIWLLHFQCIAIEDINPQAPVHFLVIPKKEIRKITDATDEDEQVCCFFLTTPWFLYDCSVNTLRIHCCYCKLNLLGSGQFVSQRAIQAVGKNRLLWNCKCMKNVSCLGPRFCWWNILNIFHQQNLANFAELCRIDRLSLTRVKCSFHWVGLNTHFMD